MRYHWIERFLRLADEVASWSKDPSTKVGAVLVDPDRRVVGVGYNGFPASVPDKQEWLDDRPTKYGLVVHAEMNAILNCRVPTKGLSLFITHPPCGECAKLVVQAGIASVWAWEGSAELRARWSEPTILNIAGVPLNLLQRGASHDA